MTSSGFLSCIPYGLILLTASYVAFVLVIVYTVPVDCLDEPCNSEGLDNSIVGFATDFWIALWMILLACQLKYGAHRPVHNSAVYALVYMGLGYIFGGLGHSIYTNSGFDDNVGQQEFYIIWTVSFTMLTASSFQIYRFASKVQQRYHVAVFGNNATTRRWLNFLAVAICLNLAAWIVTLTGYIWCATSTEFHVDEAIDQVTALEDRNDLQVCLQVATTGEICWYVTFSLLWIPVSWILRKIILQEDGDVTELEQPRKVYGFWNSWAAIWIAIIPWTFGIMLILWSGLVAIILDQEVTQIYETIYGAVVYHYGMLLGFYFFHNIAYSLPKDEAIIPADSASNAVAAASTYGSRGGDISTKDGTANDMEMASVSVY